MFLNLDIVLTLLVCLQCSIKQIRYTTDAKRYKSFPVYCKV